MLAPEGRADWRGEEERSDGKASERAEVTCPAPLAGVWRQGRSRAVYRLSSPRMPLGAPALGSREATCGREGWQ